MNKLIIISAPSGAGKTTIVNEIIKKKELKLKLSISATTRPPREHEQNNIDYQFISIKKFETLIQQNKFVEWEEVYEKQYYGTLKSEINKILETKNNIIFDIDVKGALNIKKQYKNKALTIYIKPPSINELKNRLLKRKTETEKTLNERIKKAKYELKFAPKFDKIITNNKITTAIEETYQTIFNFINNNSATNTQQ